MRVLHIVASLSPHWGGPTTVIAGLSKGLAQRGVEVTVFAPRTQEAQDKIVRPEGAEVRLFKQGFLSKIWTAYSSDMARSLNREISQFDLIHIHEIWHHPLFAACMAAKRASKPYIVTIHGALDPWCLNYKAIRKRIYATSIQRCILREAAALQALTEEEVKHVRSFGVDNRTRVIPNGIDPEEFKVLPSREVFEGLYPELREKKVVLFLGRLHPIKGLDILAKAFSKITGGRGDVHLVIAGPDSEGYQTQVERRLESEGIITKTTFTGFLVGGEKLAALSRADVFVLPSYSEGFSMAILEAMICELPVVISKQCHLLEVAEAKAGIVIDPGADLLAEALTKLLDDPQLRKEMGANGHRLVMERFTWEKVADQMVQLYEDVLKGKHCSECGW